MFLYICLQIVYYYTLLYKAVFLVPVVLFSLIPVVVSSLVPGVMSSLVPVVVSSMVPGVLSSLVPVVLFSLDPVVISSRVPRRHICSHQPCGDASREYSAGGQSRVRI